MTIESSYHSTSNRRKRSREEVSPSAYHHHCHHDSHHHHHDDSSNAPPTAKTSRPDWYLNRMDHRLQWALKCSREGNVRMMDFYLSQAKKDAVASQSYGDAFLQWESWIRGQLQQD
ncbi:unnamed protein product [Cylindrotheca closterium]|uniref:Uncharacterized protein n=1 Tax=Cylindrotheca closterium TaxID=2856 RepID=A0AAD2GCU8_9STRA|nr:unnamed protein product [Cylindrotheca closterium]